MWQEMQTQTGIQRDASINAQRAWVGLDEPIVVNELQLIPTLKVASHYSIKNFGRGPALKVVSEAWFETDPDMLPNMVKANCDSATAFASGTVRLGPKVRNPGPMGYTLFPNQPHNETIGTLEVPFQSAALPQLKHFWFIGCIGYLDQFNTVRWTRFCMEPDFYSPQIIRKDMPLKFCALYNDTDQPKH